MAKTTSTSTSKCRSCKRVVKDDDESGIACDNCSGWFHGSCAGLSKDDVSAMGRISGCLWICTSCRNDDVFQSEAKLTSLSATKEIKISVNSIQNSLIEIKKSVLEPLKVATKAHPSGDSTTSREILISGLVEQKGDFHSSFEADDSKLQEVFQHIGEPTLSIEATRRLGRPQRDSNRPRPLLIRFTSEWDARKCLSKGYKLKTYNAPVYISKSLNKEEQATRRKLLEKRYQMINVEKVPKEELRIRGLKLLRNGAEVNDQN